VDLHKKRKRIDEAIFLLNEERKRIFEACEREEEKLPARLMRGNEVLVGRKLVGLIGKRDFEGANNNLGKDGGGPGRRTFV